MEQNLGSQGEPGGYSRGFLHRCLEGLSSSLSCCQGAAPRGQLLGWLEAEGSALLLPRYPQDATAERRGSSKNISTAQTLCQHQGITHRTVTFSPFLSKPRLPSTPISTSPVQALTGRRARSGAAQALPANAIPFKIKERIATAAPCTRFVTNLDSSLHLPLVMLIPAAPGVNQVAPREQRRGVSCRGCAPPPRAGAHTA